jgi:acyl-coenzyme A thioesterase PaaI-like protein
MGIKVMSEVLEGHEDILTALRDLMPEDLLDHVPPQIFEELGVAFTVYKNKHYLAATFPAQQRFANPMGAFQGGIVDGALDVLYGSLAFFITGGRPAVTLTMESSFHRPIPANGQPFTAEVRLRAAHGRTIFLEGAVKGPDGKTAVTSATTLVIRKR